MLVQKNSLSEILKMEDRNWKIYEQINDWIQFSDQKANVFIALCLAISGCFFPKLIEYKITIFSNGFLATFSLLAVLALLSTLTFSILCIKPRLGFGEPTSLIFFGHINDKHDKEGFYKELKTYNEEKFIKEQLSEQIVTNSKIAAKKYNRIYGATISLIVFIVLILLSLITALIIK